MKTVNEQGFTLIELLVVVIIIGILAAIAIPSYLNQRQNAFDADAKTVSHNAATAAISYRAFNDSYTDMDLADLHEIEGSLPDPSVAAEMAPYEIYEVEVLGANDFRLDVKHAQGATTFRSTDSGNTLPIP